MRLLVRNWGPLAVLVVGLTGAAVFLAVQASRLWFFGDDFAFLLRSSVYGDPAHGIANALAPHNQHWSTVPVLLYRGLFAIVGIRHYLPYGLLPVLAHLVTVAGLAALLRRAGLGAWAVVTAAVVLAWYGGAAEDLLWDFQIGFLGSAMFAVLAALVVAEERLGARRVVVAALLGVLSLMCSGIGVPMVAWLGIYAWLRHDWRRALGVAVPPALAFLLWRSTAGRNQPPVAHVGVVRLGEAFVHGLGRCWATALDVPGAVGLLVWLGLLAAALLVALERPARALAVSGMAGAALTTAVITGGRAALGPDAVEASRYSYFGLLLSLPALAVVLGWAARRLRVVAPVAAAIGAGWMIVHGAATMVRFADGRANLVAGASGRLTAGAELVASGRPLLGTSLDPGLAPDILADRLADPAVRAALPRVTPTAADRVAAESGLLVAVRPRAFGLPSVLPRVGTASEVVRTPTCVSGRASARTVLVVDAASEGRQVAVTTSATSILTLLRTPAGHSRPITSAVTPGVPSYVASLAGDADLGIRPGAGRFEVCVVSP